MDGFYGAFASFWHKAGIALGSALAGWVLAWINYVPNAAVQAESVIRGLNFMMFIFPIIISVLMALTFAFYKIRGRGYCRLKKVSLTVCLKGQKLPFLYRLGL